MRVVIAPFNRMNDATLAGVRDAGHDVLCTGTESVTYAEIAAQYPVGWQPDVFIFWSPEYHPVPQDLESAPCLKVGVVGDWNLGGQAVQHVGGIFDLLIADINGADRLRALGFHNVVSAPLWSFDPDLHRRIPNGKRDIDILLVGNFNHDIQRERARWLGRVARLSSRYNVLLASGIYGEPYAHLLNRARIVFNRSIRGEINMRAYEAPACGSLLFYERENREIASLFADRRECILYSEDDLEALLDYYLTHEDERAAIAEAGFLRVQRETPSRHMLEMFRTIGGELVTRPVRTVPDFCKLPEPVAELRRTSQWLLSSDTGCFGAANAALQRAERSGGDPAEIAGLRGYLLAQAGQFMPGIDRTQAWAEALQQWQSAVVFKPGCACAHFNLASLLVETGQYVQAELQARAALELLSGGDKGAIAAGGLYWPCRFSAFGVEYDRIEISHTHLSVGWFRAMQGILRWRACELLTDLTFAAARFAEAAHFAGEAVALMPQLAATQFRHGRALNALGRLDEAILAYRAALDVNPFLGEARSGLAQGLVDAGLPCDALAVIEDWAAIIAGCPSYGSQLVECDRLRALAQRHGGRGTDEAANVRRVLAFPDWRRPSSWQDLLAAFAYPIPTLPAHTGPCRTGGEGVTFPPLAGGRVPACEWRGVTAAGHPLGAELLMLWADPAVDQPVALLRQIAAYLTTGLQLRLSDFPNITIVSQSFAPHERWKLFHAANAVLEAGPIPEQFRDVYSASHLPAVSLEDLRRRAA